MLAWWESNPVQPLTPNWIVTTGQLGPLDTRSWMLCCENQEVEHSTQGFPLIRRFEWGTFRPLMFLLLLPYHQIMHYGRLVFRAYPTFAFFIHANRLIVCVLLPSFLRKSTMGVHKQNGSKRRSPTHISLSSLVIIILSASGGNSAFIPVGRPKMSPTATGLRIRKQASSTLPSNPAPPRAVHLTEMTTGGEGEVEAGFLEKFTTGWNTVIPVGDPDELPPCPSGVSALPKPAQVSRHGSQNGQLG